MSLAAKSIDSLITPKHRRSVYVGIRHGNEYILRAVYMEP